MSTNEIKVNFYQEGDEEKILQLFATGFGKKRSLEHWNWKFKNNPYFRPISVLSWEATENQLVGQYTVMPTNLNFYGEKFLACQSLDTIVHQNFRKFGIFESGAKKCFEFLEQEKFVCVYGFPNSNSYPGFIKKLGWKEICPLERFSFKTDISARVLELVKISAFATAMNEVFRFFRQIQIKVFRAGVSPEMDSTVSFRILNEIPPEIDSLWNRAGDQKKIGVWKDKRYFEWRYGANPDSKFAFFGAYLGQDLVAFSVVSRATEPNDSAWMTEFLVSKDQVDLAQYFLLKIVSEVFLWRARSLEFICSQDDFFTTVFRIFRSIKDRNLIFCGRLLSNMSEDSKFYDPKNWRITYGDVDSL